jgi:hypothetical protein
MKQPEEQHPKTVTSFKPTASMVITHSNARKGLQALPVGKKLEVMNLTINDNDSAKVKGKKALKTNAKGTAKEKLGTKVFIELHQKPTPHMKEGQAAIVAAMQTCLFSSSNVTLR